jgi:putative transposase
MRLAGLRGAVLVRKTRRPRAVLAEAPDLIRRRFSAVRPDRVWCADLTQIWTREGWLYVAAVLDLHSRRIVGHAGGPSPSAALVEQALAHALRRRRPGRGLIHHSDWGAAYVSGPYLAALERAGVVRSHSRPGTPLDNAVIESFFSTLERELLSGQRFATRAQARLAVVDYIETFYNPRRRHSSLGYLSPVAFEASAYSQGVSTKPM